MKLNSALILDIVYPIGSYYWNNSLIDIDNVIGGHWERVKDKFVLAVGDTYAANSSGGSASHSHPLGSGYALASHFNNDRWVYKEKSVNSYQVSNFFDTGGKGTGAYNLTTATALGGSTDTTTNLPPYETAYCWKRIS